jgi:hypothetical protein
MSKLLSYVLLPSASPSVSPTTSDSKEIKSGPDAPEYEIVTSPPLIMSADYKAGLMSLKGMFTSQNAVFNIRLSRTSTHVTSGSGVMALATPIYPSLFPQYAQLSLLFQECRVRHVKMTVSSNINPYTSSSGSTQYAGGTIGFAFNARPASGSSPSTSIAEVTRLPGCRVYPALQQTPVSIRHRFPSKMPWSGVASAATGQAPVDSTCGYFAHVSIGNTLTASTAYFCYLVEAEYEFRGLY